jgi:hypothetical protein
VKDGAETEEIKEIEEIEEMRLNVDIRKRRF